MTRTGPPNTVDGSKSIWTAPFRCDGCGSVNAATLEVHDIPKNLQVPQNNGKLREYIQGQFASPESELDWAPAIIAVRDYQHTPERIASAASEAHQCHSIGAYRAASILARAVIEATSKDKGITEKKPLEWKIKQLHERDFVHKFVEEAAHEIRHIGNDMAHGDFEVAVEQVDSAEILELMDVVLNEVYEGPGKTKARRMEREAKTAIN